MRQLYKKSTARIPTLLLCVCLAFGFSATGLAQTFSGAQRTGGIEDDAGTAIAADAAGNTYVAGYFSDTVTFGPGQTRTASTGGSDIFVAKYDPAGNLVWVQQAGGAEDFDRANSIAVDAAGNSYVTGRMESVSASFSRFPTAVSSTVTIRGDGFVAKYDSAGALQWAKPISTNGVAAGFDVATDSAGNSIYVTGTFVSLLTDFGNGFVLTSALNDIFLAKYDSSGNTTWVTPIGGTGNDQGRGVTVDGSGNPHVTGYFTGTAAFGTTTFTASSSFGNAFVAKFDRNSGNVLWGKTATGFTLGSDIAVDSSGNSYVSGISTVAKFDGNPSNPNPVWYAGAIGNIFSTGVAIDAAGNSYVTGDFFGTVNFFPTTPVFPPVCVSLVCVTGSVTAGNTVGLFVAKYTNSGQLAYFQHVGSTGTSTQGQGGIAISGANFFVTGDFSGTASFPESPPVTTLTSAGGNDIWRAKYTGTSGATHFAVTAPASVNAGTSFSFTVTALDASNNTVTGYTGTVHFTSNDPNATLPPDSTLTNGTFQFSATLRTAGNNLTITATDANIGSIAGTSNTINVPAGPVTHFGFSNVPSSTPAGSPFTFKVTALDAFNNVATSYTGTVAITNDITPGLMASGTLVNGERTFSATLVKVGNPSLIATDGSISGTSGRITVTAGPATHFLIFVNGSAVDASATSGVNFPFNISARDLFDNSANSYNGIVQLTSTDGNAIFRPVQTMTNGFAGPFPIVFNTPGNQTLFVTDTALGFSGSIPITVSGSPLAPTPTGPNVTVQPVNANGVPLPISMTFSNVNAAGGTNAVPIPQIGPPANFTLNGIAYNITTTAQYTTPVTLCFTGSFQLGEHIFHFVNPNWVQLQPEQLLPSGGPYTQICAQTNSLSPFGVFTPSNSSPSASAGANQTVEATSPAGAAVSLSGAGSDADGDPLTFSWNGPCGVATGANVTLTCTLGTSAMTLTVTDGRGGSATSNVQIMVRDTTPPVIVCAAPDTAWHATDVTIACSASDIVGLLNPADASFALATIVPAGTETAAAMTGSRSVCDSSGHCATAGPIGPIKVDKKPPVVLVGAPLNSATYSLNQLVAASFSCTDSGSGVGNCNAPVANGANVDTASVGAKTFMVTTTDAVGNSTTATVNYTVVARSGLCLGEPDLAILPPIAQNGTTVFKQGATVPAQFRVCDSSDNSIAVPGFVSRFSLIQIISDGVVQNVDAEVPSSTPFTAFRWDALERQWIFNINTSGYQSGRSYRFRISLSDGAEIRFGFSLK